MSEALRVYFPRRLQLGPSKLVTLLGLGIAGYFLFDCHRRGDRHSWANPYGNKVWTAFGTSAVFPRDFLLGEAEDNRLFC